MGILILVILGAFPGEPLIQTLNIGHNFQGKEHSHRGLTLLESMLCIPRKTYLPCGCRLSASALGRAKTSNLLWATVAADTNQFK